MEPNLAEAERRIEEALRTKAESLDLGDLGLSELPASLGDLSHLRSLYLGAVRPTETGEFKWDQNRKNPKFTDLSPLSGLQALQSLDVTDTGVMDVSALSGLQALQSLGLSGTGITDVSPLSSLQALQSLDLSDTGITDVSLLSSLQALQSLDLWGTGVTDISPLSGLQALQSLSLSRTGVTDVSPLSGLQALQSLDLSHTGVTDVSPLSGLQALLDLDLWGTGVKDISPLFGLQVLKSLSLTDTKVTDVSPLFTLQALQSLSLLDTKVTDASPLSSLQVLQRLYLSGTNVTDVSPLSGLQALQCLYLSNTKVTDVSPLSGLRALRSLNLSYCSVTDVSPLSGLQALQSLNLSSTEVKDVSSLSGLQALQSLNLSRTGVKDVSSLSGLQALQSLNLSSTEVKDVSSLSGLQALQRLDLSYTGVKDVSPLSDLQALQSLDLYDCRLAIPGNLVRVFVEHPRLAELIAHEAVGVPREVFSHEYNDNCLPRLRTYFSELALGAEAENEVKVILLGNGRVGKTQLCRRFRGELFDKSVSSTHGVQIWREELRIRAGGDEKVFQVNWWDFGGQDIYHGTHALFLCSRAVFLILWTPELENREEYLESGITLRNQPLAYWLDYVRTLAGEGSPVIVVQSQCDRFADRRSPPQRPESFEFFECCAYSAQEDLGRETLEGQLRDAIRYLLEWNGALEIGHGRAEVRRRLYEWRSEDQKRKPEEREHRTLTLDELRVLCDGVGGIVSWEHALDYFHHTGVVFYQPDLFASRIILDQDWALNAVYTVFHRGRAVPWLRDSGRFTREDLAATVWHEHSPEEQKLFLGLMKSCGVCFPCGETARGETRYVAPDLLPQFEAVSGRLHAWKEEPGTPMLRLEYRFFHPAVIRGLMSDIGRRAGDVAEYWKYGLWFKDGRRDTQLLVRFEDSSTDDAPGAGALELKAQGRDSLGLLREIRKAILWRQIGEKPEELLTLEGTTVARSALATVIEGRMLDLQKKPVLAAPFAAFFEDREHDPDQARAAEMDINPQRLTESEKPREVFISYGWGDETPAGKTRAQVVDELYSALEKDGFLPVRDRDAMRPGERISAFINRLTRADLVVAVISDKYLRSSYCMYEIYRLWQKCQGDAEELIQRLVPIVLPEVRIGNVLEREPYVSYWDDLAEKMEKLIQNRTRGYSGRSWDEVRLVREFAHHVDEILVFLQDVLMPRKLEVHLEDGFQAVREALRRRIGEG